MPLEDGGINENECIYFSFGGRKNNIRISLEQFNGVKIIDVRKWFFNSSLQKFCPTQKGISLGKENFETLLSLFETHRSEFTKWLSSSAVNDGRGSHQSKSILIAESPSEQIEVVKKPLPAGNAFQSEYRGGVATIVLNETHPISQLFQTDCSSQTAKSILEAVIFSLICKSKLNVKFEK